MGLFLVQQGWGCDNALATAAACLPLVACSRTVVSSG